MAPPELCNGVDEDCDGEIDEGYECLPGAVDSCLVPCGSEGTKICNERCLWDDCIAPPEVCNGVDDDCDGTVDDGFECIPGQEVACVTTCGSTGTGLCTSACVPSGGDACLPPAEVCNRLDDDCDGITDDGFLCIPGAEESCDTRCHTEGVRTCTDSCIWDLCVPPTETCNGSDDDCDSYIDEIYGNTGSDMKISSLSDPSSDASLVFTGSEYAVAWTVTRESDSDIYFARISLSGSRIGSPVQVTDDPNYSWEPSLVFTVSEFAVAWVDNRVDFYGEIFFARMSLEGEKLSDDIRVTRGTTWSNQPSLAFTGIHFGLCWKYARFGGEIYCTALSPLGSKIGDDVLISALSSGGSNNPQLIFSESEFGLGWNHSITVYNEVRFTRLTVFGNPIGSDVVVVSAEMTDGSPLGSQVAFTGSEYGIFWRDMREGSYDLYFARISLEGERIGADYRITSASSSSYGPNVVFTGSEYAVGWLESMSSDDELFFTRLSPSGTRLDPGIRFSPLAVASSVPSLVFTGSAFGAAWTDSRTGSMEIYFTIIACLDE